MSEVTTLIGDCREELKWVDPEIIQCCVTSPPYWKQRSYLPKGHPLQPLEIGQEKTPEEYIANLVSVFSEAHRVLKDTGTLWVVIDDKVWKGQPLGLPWKFVFAMQAAGWIFITEIIWNKPNPTPASFKKKPTRAHEYIFLFSKTADYYYDRDAIRTPYAASTVPRQMRAVSGHHKHINGAPGQSPHSMSRPRLNVREIYNGEATKDYANASAQNPSDTKRRILESLMKYDGANKKTVWTVPKGGFKGKHFATYPPALIRPCILAGSKKGDMILDPFGGAGTTALVAKELERDCLLCELSEEYQPIINERMTNPPHPATTPTQSPALEAKRPSVTVA